jgi:SAM-dependent methyltransferase
MGVAQSALSIPRLDAVRDAVAEYWENCVHDESITTHPAGSPGFFRELDEYHFDKQRHLLKVIPFDAYRGRRVLDIGCGVGIDLARFARGGAIGVGVDLSASSIDLARLNFAQQQLVADFTVMDAESLEFEDGTFDLVYCYDTLHYAANPAGIAHEAHRVLKPGGTAILQVYNRRSWLWLMSKAGSVGLEHEDAPVLRPHTIDQFNDMLGMFAQRRLFTERFPVPSRLHGSGVKGLVYNEVLVRGFNLLPRRLVQNYGWHIIVFATKAGGGSS